MNTLDTEWEKVQWREVPKQVGVTLNIGDKYTYVETRLNPEEMRGIKELIEYSLTSRDTYWKGRVRKDVERIEKLYDRDKAIDTLLDNLK